MAPDSHFEQYWKNPSDKKVDELFCQTNWGWLLNENSDLPAKSCDRHDTRPEFSGFDMDKYLESIRRRIDDDGYYSSANIDAYPPDMSGLSDFQIGKLQRAVKLLVYQGYPASFVLLLDECWDAVDSMREMMLAGTGNSVCNMDILAWLVDPNEGSGFSPHRDRQVSCRCTIMDFFSKHQLLMLSITFLLLSTVSLMTSPLRSDQTAHRNTPHAGLH